MLTRRTLIAAPLAMPFVVRAADAATPKSIAVMAKTIDDIVSFDPAESYEFTNNEVDANCYRRLIVPDPADGTKIKGDLAHSWDVSADGKTFTFHLKSEAAFETGRKLTADDVAFSLQRVVKLNKTPGFILTQFGLAPDTVEQAIVATDPQTVRMVLPTTQATSFVLYCLSANVGSIVDRATVMAHDSGGDMGNAWLKSHTAGAGPYKLTQWQASDHIVIDANPHAAVHGKMRRIVIRHVVDPSAQLLLLQKGDIDIARDLGADQLRAIASNAKYTMLTAAQARSMYIAMNQSVGLLAKPQVHEAIKWAIDYEAIARNITPNTWSVSQSFLPKGLPGALTDTPYHRDVERAKKLLADAGLPNGFPITMDYISGAPYADIAQAVQANLADVGIKAQLLPGEQKQVITKTRARQHQLAMLVWGSDYFDPNSNAQGFCANPDDSDASKLKILAWRSHFVDSQLTTQVAQAAREIDPAKRIALYQTMQKEFMAEAPFAVMLQKNEVAVQRQGVSGLLIGPLPDYTDYTHITKA